jgi:hypothetical protein
MVCRVFFSGTRQRASLPSAKEKTLGKNKTLGKEGSLPSVKKRNTRQRKFQIKI